MWQQIASRLHYQWIWESGQSLAKHIQALEPNLIRNYGMETVPATNNAPKKYRFIQNMVDFSEQEEEDKRIDQQETEGYTIDLDRFQEE